MNNSILEISASNTIYYVNLYNDGSFKFLNQASKPVDIVKAPSYGFKGYEEWASTRGYIWSRSIPLLKDTVLLGHGPDTYAIYFPQNDFSGKLQHLNMTYILVDKPHNMYLQIAINTGVVSLIAFLVFVLWYISSSFSLYFKPKKNDSFYYMAGSACVLSVIGFLVAGLANDSNVNISPIFWIMLGIGFACNRLYKKELLVFDTNTTAEIPALNKPSKKVSKSPIKN
ncbi:MAG: O-antigen ligase family protein, partial [Ruminiclostridium sp.]